MPQTSFFHRARESIERGYARWGEISYAHPWRILAAAVLIVGFFSSYLPSMTVDMSTESYLHEDNPARVKYDAFQVQFGRDERIVVLAETDGLLDIPTLERMRALHRDLQRVEHVAKVDSLINARLTYGEDDALIVRDLLEYWPQNDADLAALGEILRTKPLYQKLFVNPSLDKTVFVLTPATYASDPVPADDAALDAFDFDAAFADPAAGGDAAPVAAEDAEFLSGEDQFGIINDLQALLPQHQADDFRLGLAGGPYMMHQLTYVLGRDMFKFSFIGVFVISALLFAIFRRWVMVILPVTVGVLALYTTFTLMAFTGMPVTTSVQILPSLLLAVGVGNSVHIFTVFFQAIGRGEGKREALAYALGHSGFAVTMTALTTAGGLVSFITADMKPISDIGIVSPMGIILTLLYSILVMPALMAVTPFKQEALRDDEDSPLQRFLAACARISTRHPRRMIGVWFGLIGISLVLVMQIVPSHYPLHWFGPDSDLRRNTQIIDGQFGGGTYMEIVVDSGKDNGLHDPELLHRVDEALSFVDELEVNGVRLGNANSLIDINKELHQALNGNDPAYYRIPDERQLIAQELLLFENSGSADLTDLVDSGFSKMRISLRMPFVDGTLYPDYLDALQTGFRDIIGDQAELTFTGIVSILSSTIKVLIGDTIRAYLLAILIISPLMMLMLGSVRTGLISMLPNLAPIVITLALMSVLDIPLDAFTLLIGSIALGLAVDDTIHFMHNYQRYNTRYGDNDRAVHETLRTTGKALLVTSLVLSCGFFINMAGEMINLQHFGLLTGFCIIVAFLADALFAPALVTVLSQIKQRKIA